MNSIQDAASAGHLGPAMTLICGLFGLGIGIFIAIRQPDPSKWVFWPIYVFTGLGTLTALFACWAMGVL